MNTQSNVFLVAPISDTDYHRPVHQESSQKNLFSWIKIEGHSIPAISHLAEHHVAVKILEKTILSHFPNVFPEEMKNQPPLASILLQSHHVKLLNELNCKYRLGYREFHKNDSMVLLTDFIDFYKVIKFHYPNCVKKIRRCATKDGEKNEVGWFQINSTIVPFVSHDYSEFLPATILTNSAKLNIANNLMAFLPEEKVSRLNHLCSDLKMPIVFNFQSSRFVPLHFVQDIYKDIHTLQKIDRKVAMQYMKPHPFSPLQGTVNSQCPKVLPTNSTLESNYSREQVLGYINSTQDENVEFQNCDVVSSGLENQTSNHKHSQETQANDLQYKNVNPRTEDRKKVPCVATVETTICCGETLICLKKDSIQFVLVEAVQRVFFPAIPLPDFKTGIDVICKTSLPECDSKEEQAFQKVYGIPNVRLNSRKLIELGLLQTIIPELRKKFHITIQKQGVKRRLDHTGDAKSKKKIAECDVICID